MCLSVKVLTGQIKARLEIMTRLAPVDLSSANVRHSLWAQMGFPLKYRETTHILA